MKKLVALACTVSACAWTLCASAQSDPVPREPDVVMDEGMAGAPDREPGEETYLPGPGGDNLEPRGLPPLESTGLEDGIGSGCKCSSAIGAHQDTASLSLAFLVGSVLLARRKRAASESRP